MPALASAQDARPTPENPLPLMDTLDELEMDGPFLWQNLGPVLFEDDEMSPRAGAAVQDWMRGHARDHLRHPEGFPVSFETTTRLGSDGQLWAIVDVDWDLYEARIEAYDAASVEPEPARDGFLGPWDDEGEDEGEYIPTSWTNGTCWMGYLGTVDWALWNGESRNQITASTLTLRQQTSVYVRAGVDPIRSCSGVLVHSRWVLTNAHCVIGANGYRRLPKNINVSLGNNQYYPSGTVVAEDVLLDGEPWNGNARTDYALIKLASPLGTQHMRLSSVGNATIESHDVTTLGYPGSVNGTSCSNPGGKMYREKAAVIGVTTHVTGRGVVKTQLDNTSGQSGSPMFYCPGGSSSHACGPNQQGYVVGLVGGVQTSGGSALDTRGPKVPGRLRNWAVPYLPNH